MRVSFAVMVYKLQYKLSCTDYDFYTMLIILLMEYQCLNINRFLCLQFSTRLT